MENNTFNNDRVIIGNMGDMDNINNMNKMASINIIGGGGNGNSVHGEYDKRTLSDVVIIKPMALGDGKTIQDLLLERLKQKVEGICISDGYVRPESVEIVGRSMGCMENHDFESNMTFAVSYNCEICNPKQGQILECQVAIADDTNIVCYIGDEETSPVELYLFKENHLGDTIFNGLRIGDKLKVGIIETIVQFGKPKVLATAQFLGRLD